MLKFRRNRPVKRQPQRVYRTPEMNPIIMEKEGLSALGTKFEIPCTDGSIDVFEAVLVTRSEGTKYLYSAVYRYTVIGAPKHHAELVKFLGVS